MPEPMKPAEAWAHVKEETGEMTFICEPDDSKDVAASWMVPGERLARVRITEVEEPKP